VLGAVGIVAAVLVPFAPVLGESTTASWPRAGRLAESTTAFFVPYAPEQVHAQVPCSAVRAGAGASKTLVSSALPGKPNDGFRVVAVGDQMIAQVGGREVRAPVPNGECSAALDADAGGASFRVGDRVQRLPDAHVRSVSAFATDLTAQQAAGVRVSARTTDWFTNTPSTAKLLLIGAQLALAAGAFAALVVADRGGLGGWIPKRVAAPGPVDAGVLGALGLWAVVGPMTPDDGFATTIARQAWLTGDPGNYYRWQNASETPFTLVQRVLEPVVGISSDPLVLRMPSVLAGVLTWFALSRGVLPVLLPMWARGKRVSALAAVAFLAWWMPFDLGARPEALVALGGTVSSACALRAAYRPRCAHLLAPAALAAVLAVVASPAGVTAFAPFAVLLRPLLRRIRAPESPVWSVVSVIALVGSVAGAGLVVAFAEQSWSGAIRATALHEAYAPRTSAFHELLRYQYLLGDDLQGAFARRVPVLLTAAVVVSALLVLRRRRVGRVPVVIACFAVGLGLLWLTPSKWTHYFGSFAGMGAAALTCAVVVLFGSVRRVSIRRAAVVGVVGSGLCAVAAALSFAGRNTWFLHSEYGILGEGQRFWPLNRSLLWLVLAVAVLLRGSRSVGKLPRTPAVLACVVSAASVVLMLVSFTGALFQQGYSLGRQNLAALSGKPDCGLEDALTEPPSSPPLRKVLSSGPTYVDWSLAWSFPCVRNQPLVRNGLAQTPTALVEAPQSLGFAGQAAFVRSVGGTFAGVEQTVLRTEVPAHLPGREGQWGRISLVHYPVRRDAYDTNTSWYTRSGWQGPTLSAKE
jgi:arabinosyltransferase C